MTSLQNVIVTTLLLNGGTATSTTVYTAVGSVFPSLRKNMDELTYNVRWARMSLAEAGLIAQSKVRGEYTLTAAGRKAARALFTA
jgi:Mrr N-terminal domain